MWNDGDSVIDRHRVIYEDTGENKRGVGLIVDQGMNKCVLGYFQLYDCSYSQTNIEVF